MFKQLGVEIQNLARASAGFKEHSEARDVVWLWLTIQRVYHRGAALSQDVDTANALASFTTSTKRRFESIHEYFKRFEEEYIAYCAAGGPELSESVRVAIFNNGIGSTHAGYVASVRNKAARGARVPETLEANYRAASNFVTGESGKEGGAAGAAVIYYTGDQMQARSKQSKKDSTNKEAGGKHKSKKKSAGKDSERRKPIACFGCGGPHMTKDCPEVAAEEASDARSETKVNAAVVPVVAAVGRVPARFLVAMDSGAYTSVFNNAELLSNVEDVGCAPLLDWHGSKMQN